MEHKRPLNLGDSALVRTRVSTIHRHGVRVEFEIFRASDEKLSAAGWYEYVMIHLSNGRPAIIPDDIVAKYSV